MFESSDDINFDEGFLNDVLDQPNNEHKRNSDSLNEQPVKKKCTASPDKNTVNILSIIKSKSQPNPRTSPNINTEKPEFKFPSNLNKNSPARLNVGDKTRRVVQRKFPGPAGILPEQKQLQVKIKTLKDFDSQISNETLESEEIVCSQFTEDIFKKGPWLRMCADWCDSNYEVKMPDKYTIAWTKSKATSKRLLAQKTPFLAAVIQTVDCTSKTPMILLKDRTGEIQATVIHEEWDEYCEVLKPGSVIVLKQVGVLSTTKKHYLTITLDNLITIYSEQENDILESSTKITNMQQITVPQFLKSIEDFKKSYKAQKILQKIEPLNNNPYFKTTLNSVSENNYPPNLHTRLNNPQNIRVNSLGAQNIPIKNSPNQARNENVNSANLNQKSAQNLRPESDGRYVSTNLRAESQSLKHSTLKNQHESVNTYQKPVSFASSHKEAQNISSSGAEHAFSKPFIKESQRHQNSMSSKAESNQPQNLNRVQQSNSSTVCSKPANKFNFKAKLNESKNCNETATEVRHVFSSTVNSDVALNDLDLTFNVDNSENYEIASQTLTGLDPASIFGEF